MASELHQYFDEYMHFSAPGNRFRLWGVDQTDFADNVIDIDPIGIAFHYPQRWETFRPCYGNNPDSLILRALYEITERLDIPLIWFGEYTVDYRGYVNDEKTSRFDTVEIGKICKSESSDVPFVVDRDVKEVDELAHTIQHLFGTDFEETGSTKPENKTTNPFAYFSKVHLPTRYTIQDIDGLYTKDPSDPTTIVEIKRADASPKTWTPYTDDFKQYYLLVKTANEADLNCHLIQHQKQQIEAVDGELDDVRLYENIVAPSITSVPPYIRSHSEVEEELGTKGEEMPAREALQRIQSE